MLILNDAELRKKLGRQAAEAAKQYAWEVIAERVLQLYQSVLEV